MENVRSQQALDQSGFKRNEFLSGEGQGILDELFGDGQMEEIVGGLGQASRGDELDGTGVEEKLLEARSVLNGSGDAGREFGVNDFSRDRAPFALSLVFGDDALQGREVKDLPALDVKDGDFGEIRATPTRAPGQGMEEGMVGVIDQGQRVTGMILLAAGFATGRGAQAFGSGLDVSVGGGRF